MPIDTLNLAPASGINCPDSLPIIRFAIFVASTASSNRAQNQKLVSSKSRTFIAIANAITNGFCSEGNDRIASGVTSANR